jgi:GxxExxY protein
VDENGIGEAVIGCAIRVHRALGPGLLENAYEACLTHEITKTGLSCQRQIVLPIIYDRQKIEAGYRLGYLLNFNVSRMKDGVSRMVNGL